MTTRIPPTFCARPAEAKRERKIVRSRIEVMTIIFCAEASQ